MLDLQWLESSDVHPDELEAAARNMATLLRHLLDQRDSHLEVLDFLSSFILIVKEIHIDFMFSMNLATYPNLCMNINIFWLKILFSLSCLSAQTLLGKLDFDSYTVKVIYRLCILQTIAELMQEKEGVVSLLNSPSSPQSVSYSPSMQQQAGTQQHLAVELADSKAKIRRLRQEL